LPKMVITALWSQLTSCSWSPPRTLTVTQLVQKFLKALNKRFHLHYENTAAGHFMSQFIPNRYLKIFLSNYILINFCFPLRFFQPIFRQRS
jgi:hypothetical protein